MERDDLIGRMIDVGRSLFERGHTPSGAGSISHRWNGGFLIQARGSSFGRLRPRDLMDCDTEALPRDPAQVTRPVGLRFRHAASSKDSPKPTEDAPLHAAIYRRRPEVQAVLHLRCPGAIALSTLVDPTDDGNVLPVVTPYAVLRVGRVPMLEYLLPGSERLTIRIGEMCAGVNALVLQNHGLMTFAPDLDQAVEVAEEFEQNARVWLDTRGQARLLDDAELQDCRPILGGDTIRPGEQRPTLRKGVTLTP